MNLRFANNAVGTLAASITATDTSILLQSGHGAVFPVLTAGQVCLLTLVDSSNNTEIVRCTARAADTLTVVRGQEGNAARAYAAGDRIGLRITAGGLARVLQRRDVVVRSANTEFVEADIGRTIRATASFTQTFAAAAALGDGWHAHYLVDGGVTITFDPAGAETIDAAATLVVAGPASLSIVCDGTTLRTLFNATGGEYRRTLVFAAVGGNVWTRPARLGRIRVTLYAGGGAGGGSTATASSEGSVGGGGGAGGVAIRTIEAAVLGATETVTVGGPGIGVVGAAGSSGGTSSFGAHCSASGGAGASLHVANAGPFIFVGGALGGAGSGGEVTGAGANGGVGTASGGATFVMGGAGASSALGSGGLVQHRLPGASALGFSAGGAGATSALGDAARAGGAGGQGIVIVEEFF